MSEWNCWRADNTIRKEQEESSVWYCCREAFMQIFLYTSTASDKDVTFQSVLHVCWTRVGFHKPSSVWSGADRSLSVVFYDELAVWLFFCCEGSVRLTFDLITTTSANQIVILKTSSVILIWRLLGLSSELLAKVNSSTFTSCWELMLMIRFYSAEILHEIYIKCHDKSGILFFQDVIDM